MTCVSYIPRYYIANRFSKICKLFWCTSLNCYIITYKWIRVIPYFNNRAMKISLRRYGPRAWQSLFLYLLVCSHETLFCVLHINIKVATPFPTEQSGCLWGNQMTPTGSLHHGRCELCGQRMVSHPVFTCILYHGGLRHGIDLWYNWTQCWLTRWGLEKMAAIL